MLSLAYLVKEKKGISVLVQQIEQGGVKQGSKKPPVNQQTNSGLLCQLGSWICPLNLLFLSPFRRSFELLTQLTRCCCKNWLDFPCC